LHHFYRTPFVKPFKEKTVPRHYIRNISTTVIRYMKENFWGDPENKLTYMELATFGLSFLSNIEQVHEENGFIPGTIQYDAAAQICAKFNRDEVLNTAFKDVQYEIWYLTRSYSRVNYRMYGFELCCEEFPRSYAKGSDFKVSFRLTARESESKNFLIKNIFRKAYRMFETSDGLYFPKPMQFFKHKFYPKAGKEEMFNVYVQSHVLHRFKQRVDTVSPSIQNLLFLYAFTRGAHLVRFQKQTLFASLVEDERPIGYFTYFVQGDDMIINTFLPLTSADTPEGKKLNDILSLSKEELIYLGMDKLSFLLRVDFDQIPELKQALIASDLWETKEVLHRMYYQDEPADHPSPIDQPKTQFIKAFFDKQNQLRS
jgi:hypothetical protein